VAPADHQDGYVQITLKELPHSPGSKMIPVEMAVIDTGKGIGKDFLKDQLFHPFSQENPLQTGTGLGLAIVNSIVRSDNVNGKVDVWSSEGRGTEIRVSFEVEVFDEEDDQSMSSESSVTSSASGFGRGHSVSFFGYDMSRRGSVLALDVLSSYAGSWQFDLQATPGDIYVINEAEDLMHKYRDTGKPLILLQSSHTAMTTGLRDAINKSGGFCQIVHKPIGPTVLRQALHRAVVWLERGGGETTPMSEIERPSFSRNESERTDDSTGSNESTSTISDLAHRRQISGQIMTADRQPLLRRRSEEPEHSHQHATPARPALAPRGLTYHHGPPDIAKSITNPRKSSITSDTSEIDTQSPTPGSPGSSASHLSTISLADGGVMLKAAQLPSTAPRMGRPPRVMVVEDNIINRRVLGAFLKKRVRRISFTLLLSLLADQQGYEWAEAYDGRSGVNLFNETDPDYWDVILMDISMPVMNGHEATRAIRKIEASRRSGRPPSEIPTPKIPAPGQPITPTTIALPPPKVLQSRVKIFALTGLATSDDKREAFGSGVDG
jgi:CheY-like chemotaxis protein